MEQIKYFVKTPVGMTVVSFSVLGVLVIVIWVVLSLGGEEDSEGNGSAVDNGSIPTETTDNEREDYSASSAISDSEISSIEQGSRNLLFHVGDFGVSREFNGEYPSHQEIANAGLFETREENYLEIRDSMLIEGTELYFSDSRVQNWDETSFAGFEIDDVVIRDIVGPNTINVNGSNTQSVVVTVDWSGSEYFYEVTATDTSWDGSYYVMERDYEESGAEIRFANIDGEWRVHSIDRANNLHATTLWSNPTPENMPYRDTFENIDMTPATQEAVEDPASDPDNVEAPNPPSSELDQIESDLNRGERDRFYSPPNEEDLERRESQADRDGGGMGSGDSETGNGE